MDTRPGYGTIHYSAPTSTAVNVGTRDEFNEMSHTDLRWLPIRHTSRSKQSRNLHRQRRLLHLNVDCGFTGGARFILIKRTDSSGDWYYL